MAIVKGYFPLIFRLNLCRNLSLGMALAVKARANSRSKRAR